jgi:hypothetical protein
VIADLSWLTSAPAEDFLAALAPLDEAAQNDALWLRCEHDLPLFCAAFLGERFPLRFSPLHHALLTAPKVPWTSRPGPLRRADAAPRGHAKSTVESFAGLLHDVVYGLELFVAVISTTYDLAEKLVQDLHGALAEPELHPDLHAVYGPFRVKGGSTDFVVHVPGGDPRGIRIAAFSFGGNIRGQKHAGVRPTKVLIDDGEDPKKVASPTQRAKTWDYFHKDILKAGDYFTAYRFLGTVLHPDSLLANLLRAPGWQSTRWQAILSWPKRMDLWEACRRLWADLTDPDREATARSFYERHRAAMDEGAAVLWPEKDPLYALMVMGWAEGMAALLSEKQNDPTDPERQVFAPDLWPRCKFDGETVTTKAGRRIPLSSCRLSVWLDPRASRELVKGDYAACALVAREQMRHGPGYTFVLKCLLERATTEQQLAWLWTLFERYPSALYGYEDNGFQQVMGDLLERERQARKQRGLAWNLTLHGHASTTEKLGNDRILGLAPRVALGWIEWAEDLPPLVLEQFRQIPTGAHDDGPDAIERAIWHLDNGGGASVDLGASWGGSR